MKPIITAAILLSVAACSCAVAASDANHGMTLVLRTSAGYEEELVTYNLYRLADVGVDSLCILAMWFVDNLEDPTLEPWYLDEPGFPDAGFFHPTLRDEEIAFIADTAHSLGMTVMLKLHSEPLDWSSRGADAPGHEALHPGNDDWDALFTSYGAFLDHYAALCEELGIETLCIGTELESMTIPSPDGPPDPDRRWRELIASARRHYDGNLTYSTSFGGRFPQTPGSSSQESITFWDALDSIGIEFYGGISATNAPSYGALLANLRWIFKTFYEPLAAAYDRPIIIPEAAFASFDGACVSIEPSANPYDPRIPDYEEQADCHRALLQVVGENEYISGIYWWAGTLLAPNDGHRWQTTGTDTYLWGKPVEAVLRDVWADSRLFDDSSAIPTRTADEESGEAGTAILMELPSDPEPRRYVKALPADGWWFDSWDGDVDLPVYPIARLESSATTPTAVFRRSPCSSHASDAADAGTFAVVVVDGFSRGTRSLRDLEAFWVTVGSQGFTEPAPSVRDGAPAMRYTFPEDGDGKLFLKFETPFDASAYDGVEVVLMADAPTSVRVEVASRDPGLAGGMNEDDWKTMYPSCALDVTDEWAAFRLPFSDFVADPDELFRFPGMSAQLMRDAVWEVQFFVENLGRTIWIRRVAFYDEDSSP